MSVALVIVMYGCILIAEGLLVLACLPWALRQAQDDPSALLRAGSDAIP
jgi:hypothetical protein